MLERMPLIEKATNIQECQRVFGNISNMFL